MSERRACRLVNLARSVFRYAAHPHDDSEVQTALAELAAQHPEFGFRKMFLTLRRVGHIWNHKRVYRVYRQLKLNLKRKHKRRIPTRNPLPLAVPFATNQVWSADFMSDALWDGRRFRTFNVIDDFNREALAIEVDSSISAHRVVRILDQIAAWRGLPERIRFDNGPELTALAVADWAEENGVELAFIKPGCEHYVILDLKNGRLLQAQELSYQEYKNYLKNSPINAPILLSNSFEIILTL